MSAPHSLKCARTREWISLALDDELAELQRALVAAHLRRCADCRAFELATHAFTDELRRSKLSAPGTPIALGSRPGRFGRSRLGLPHVGAAAAAAAAALLSVNLLPERQFEAVDEPRFAGASVVQPAPANALVVQRQAQSTAVIGAVKPPLPASPS